VIEAPFPELQDDLGVGGRYAFGDGFRADYGRVSAGLASVVEYVTRRHPVDAARVVVAGAGDGGTVVLWTSLYGEWLAADFVALDPTDLKRLAMEALPDQPPVARSLQLLAAHVAQDQLDHVAADYRKVGLEVAVAPLGDGDALVDQVRTRLGLPPRAPLADAAEPLLLVLPNDLPRTREWAALHEDSLRRLGKSARVVHAADVPPGTPAERVRRLEVGGDGHWTAKSFANGFGLPLAGGPFGGTTVIVLPAGQSDADRAAWQELEQKKVLKRRSMFANIAIANTDAEPSLPQVLATLRGMGRSRVLVVPAVFCADAALMRGLRDGLDEDARAMDLSWLPGLGAELTRMGH
jgi:sirohydrochlorin ferrochelatase